MKRGFVGCSECGSPVAIASPEDRRAGVMCLACEGDVFEDITVLYYEVNKDPVPVTVQNRLAEFQRLVDGYIEQLKLSNGLLLICNEEDKMEGQRPNRRIGNELIVGNFFITAAAGEEYRSLTSDEIAAATRALDGTGIYYGV